MLVLRCHYAKCCKRDNPLLYFLINTQTHGRTQQKRYEGWTGQEGLVQISLFLDFLNPKNAVFGRVGKEVDETPDYSRRILPQNQPEKEGFAAFVNLGPAVA